MGSKLKDLIPFDAGAFYVADLEKSCVVAEHVVGLEGGTNSELQFATRTETFGLGSCKQSVAL
jgi:hypothetical protein